MPTAPGNGDGLSLAVWLVPVAVAVAGVWQPRAGLLILAACLPLFGSPPGGPYLAALDVAALAAIATAWRAGRWRPSSIDAAVAAFGWVSLSSMLPVAYRPPSWHPRVLVALLTTFPGVESWTLLYTWRALANLLLGLGLYLTVRRAYTGRDIRPLGLALAGGLTAALVLGLAEHAGLVDLGGYRAVGGPIFATRLHSLFFHSGWYAEYLVMAAPLAIAALVAFGRLGRLMAVTVAVLTLLTVPLTEARGAWVAALAEALTLVALSITSPGPRPWRLVRMSALALAGTALTAAALLAWHPQTLAPLAARLQYLTNLTGRPLLWRAAGEMLAERPALGWGLGSFAPVYDQHRPPRTRYAVPTRATAHSLYLTIAAERGLLGLAAFGLLGGSLAAAIHRRLRQASNGERPMAVALAMSLVGIAVYGIVQYLLFLKMLEWLFWILVAAVAVTDPSSAPARRGRPTRILVLIATPIALWRAVAVGYPCHQGSRSFGLHEPESDGSRTWQWSEGRAAIRLGREGSTLVVALANGHPRPGRHPVHVELAVDGHPAGRLDLDDGWREHRIRLGPSPSRTLLLELTARPTFRPFQDYRDDPDLAPSSDIRCLGVVLGPPRWESRPSAERGPARPAAAQTAPPALAE